jgi:Pectate lyase superfamily protein/SMP-30/Gluconolactonase/LRE-like region
MLKPTTKNASRLMAGLRTAEVKLLLVAALALLSAATASPTSGPSYYPSRVQDSKAVYLDSAEFSVHGDGQADDTDALQSAVNKVQHDRNQGIVFVPAGRYRLSRTIYIWPGIRLIGFGATRPTFVLARNTPGFQQGPSYMVFFAGSRPAGFQNIGAADTGTTERPKDANPGTFYSALSNIDIEIQDGNPGAVGVRARYAQHCYMSHMDFNLGSALAGIHDGGNVAIDLHFHGGQFGIWTRKPSPGWQFTVIDSSFDGQREAAIREHEAGLTLIRPEFKNIPTAISIDATYADELWIKDGRFENVSGPALIISNENNPRTEINAENLALRDVPVFAEFRESGKKLQAPGEQFVVKTFSHGFHLDDLPLPNAEPQQIQTVFEAAPVAHLPAPVPSDIPDLPAMESWVNVRDLGAHGDAKTDDADILRKAIAEHAVLYFPSGQYLVSDTIALKPDTVLIGLHPSTTRIFLADGTPAFQGDGNPKPLLETPSGGKNIVTGLGLYTNGINPRAVAAFWRSGSQSLMNDVRFLGGHGTIDPDASAEESRKVWTQIYNNTHTADSNLNRRWDGQYPSLWVTEGGGGTFVNIWTPSTFAQAGLYVSHTATPGRVYELSSEHHVRNEAVFDDVSNWQVFALQTEEERGEGGFALPLEIRDSKNLLIANMHIYRVVSAYQPAPYAILLSRSSHIRLRNIHCYSDSKASFDNAVYDQTSGAYVRQREFAWLDISGKAPAAKAKSNPTVLDDDAGLKKLAGGFFNISGGAVDQAGNIYFVDAKWQIIYCWSVTDQQLSKVRDNPLDPVQLAFDRVGNLMVISYAGNGTVYSFDPHAKSDEITLLKAQPAVPRPGLTAILPADVWRNENDFSQTVPARKPYQFVSPDSTTFIPAGEDFVSGELYYGSKIHDVLRAFGMTPVPAGKRFYVTNEEEQKTYSASIDSYGSIADLKLFRDVGGESVATDQAGNVYIAAGQIFVYDPSGKYLETIAVPERPSQLLFGGPDGKTLFIAARSSLYAVPTRYQGN